LGIKHSISQKYFYGRAEDDPIPRFSSKQNKEPIMQKIMQEFKFNAGFRGSDKTQLGSTLFEQSIMKQPQTTATVDCGGLYGLCGAYCDCEQLWRIIWTNENA
jgi:hypothetical protein